MYSSLLKDGRLVDVTLLDSKRESDSASLAAKGVGDLPAALTRAEQQSSVAM